MRRETSRVSFLTQRVMFLLDIRIISIDMTPPSPSARL
jgi:hypothetical protein